MERTMTQAIPNGFHTITPSFMFKNSKAAIEFYQKAFNAETISFMPSFDGKGTMHAQLKIGNSMIMMGDEMPGNEQCSKSAETLGHSPISMYVYVDDVDSAFQQAVDAGAQVTMPIADMFWGDRVGQVKDPFGYSWMIASHTVDLNNEQIKQRAEEFFAAWQNKK
jgi:uncharacterized glyoxalase superfamily protein PhnB